MAKKSSKGAKQSGKWKSAQLYAPGGAFKSGAKAGRPKHKGKKA